MQPRLSHSTQFTIVVKPNYACCLNENVCTACVPAEAAAAPMTIEGIPIIKTVPAATKQVAWAWAEEAAERILWYRAW